MMSLGWRRYPGITVAVDRTLKMSFVFVFFLIVEGHQIEIGNTELKSCQPISKLYDVPVFGERTD